MGLSDLAKLLRGYPFGGGHCRGRIPRRANVRSGFGHKPLRGSRPEQSSIERFDTPPSTKQNCLSRLDVSSTGTRNSNLQRRPRRSCPQEIRARLVGRAREAAIGSVVEAWKRCGDGQTQTAGTPNLVVGDSVADKMPDKKKYLVRTWSVPGERESVEVTYRQAMDMAKKVKRNADCTGPNNPSFKRVKREVEAVDHWIQAMQSPDWLSSEYVVGPIRSSNPGRGDDTAEMTVNGDEADDQLVFDDFGYDDYGGCEYQCDENAPPNASRGDVDDRNFGDTVAPESPEESRAAGLDFSHRIDLAGMKSAWLDRVTEQYSGKPVTHILDAIKDIIQGGGSLESIKTCFDSLAKAFSQAFPGDVLPNLLPTGRELEQLWMIAENAYKSC